MSTSFDAVEFASVLADIAGKTQDPETARRLMELVSRLLTAAGLRLA